MKPLVYIVLIFNEKHDPIEFEEFKNFSEAETWAKKKIDKTLWYYQIETTLE